ncbi:MAG TPA: TIGR02996 domain-containing protein, partial [Kofleriaceae bacterium]
MADDRRFLELVGERPDDFDLRMVYADWLEETGELGRASFLRDQLALFRSVPDDPDLLTRGSALRALGESLPADWIASVSFPALAGTVWSGRDSMKKRLVLRFLPTGTLSYTQDDTSRTFENGTWRQIGNVAIAETNGHYADYQGVVTGDSLRGASHNVVNFSWTWELERTFDPQLVDPGGTVIKTVYGHAR